MYSHLLVFTEDDRALLRKRYLALMMVLEEGKEIEKNSMDELAESMRVILQSQKELQPFWQQVQQHPSKHYQLHLTHADKELLNLPWHLAIDPKQYPFIHISKGATGVTSLPAYIPQPGPLRILVMISSPEDLNYNKRLSYEEEEQRILKALSSLLITGQVQVHFTEDGSLAGLQQKLQLQHYHILYFSGHGTYKNGSGYLQLENPVTFNSEEVKAQEFMRVLKEGAGDIPPLIILSSCQTAQGAMEEGFRGVADELIHEGVPAVIAMAFSIKDQFNIIFSEHLYEQLANKRSLPESWSNALQDMRRQEQQQLEMAGQHIYNPSQWLIPQLYISQQVIHIVDWQMQEQTSMVTDPRFIEGGNDFIGRRRECAVLLNELIRNKPVLITGQGGIGKTSLAGYLVKRLVVQDTIYHCFSFNETNMGFTAIAAELKQFLKTVDPSFQSFYEKNKLTDLNNELDLLIKRVAKHCTPVWIFDNLEMGQQNTGGQLTQEYNEWINYLQQRLFGRFPVVLIGRYEIPELNDVFKISLNQVPFVDFYRKCIQLDLKDLHTKISLPGIAQIASLLYDMFGGSYRTLELLNELYKNNPAKTEALLQQVVRLKDAQYAKELMAGVQQQLKDFSKQLVFTELITLLTREEQKTLHLLLYFQTPVMPLALEKQQPAKDVQAELQRLKNLTLIEEHIHKTTGNKLYYIAPLVKNSIEGIQLPQVYFYPEYAGDYYLEAGKQLTLSLEDVEAAIPHYAAARCIAKLNEAGMLTTNQYYKLGLFDKTLTYGKLVEKVAGDETTGDILNNLGATYLKFGHAHLALTYFTKFSICARKANDKKNLAAAFNAIGNVYMDLEDHDTAMEWLQKSYRLSKAGNYREEEAVTLSNIGSIYKELGEYDKAMKALKQSWKLREQLNDRVGLAHLLNNMAAIYDDRGDYQKKKETLQNAFSLAVETGHKQLQGSIMNNMGSFYLEEENYSAALVCFQKGLAVSESVNNEIEMGNAMTGMGTVYKILGKHNEAVEYITKGSSILQKYNDPDVQTDALVQIGNINIDRGDPEDSLPFLQMALANYRQRKMGREEAQALYYIGDAYLNLGETDKSIKCLEECISILEKEKDTEIESMALARLSQAHAAKKETDKVLKYQERNLELSQATGNRSHEAITLVHLATAYHEKGLPELYLYYMLQAYTIYNEENDLHGLYFTSSIVGEYLCIDPERSYIQEGIWLLEQAYELGIQSDEYPGVENVADLLEKFQQLPVKKKKKPVKQKQTEKKKPAAQKQPAESKSYTGMKVVWRGK